ncbi:MAG: hypothetical protein EHM87_19295 [Burkholderiales bacterium]|nr:MAG: hypothetical protein EHM87_19295 [Burkholderiales bacterium]
MMDTLWASLIGLFVIALAVVLGFNLLQGRQTRLRDAWRDRLAGGGKSTSPAAPRGEPSVGGGHRAPAGAGGAGARVEPTFGPAGVAGTDGSEPPQGRGGATAPIHGRHDGMEIGRRDDASSDPDHHGNGTDADRAEAAYAEAQPEPAPAQPSHVREAQVQVQAPDRDTAVGPILDPRLDCIVVLGVTAPVAAERLLAAASTLRRAGSKPIAVEADDGDGRWTVPHASLAAVRRVRAGVLLANRHGPLNAMEFSEFTTAMQSLGRAIGAGGAIVPDMAPVLEHARQLDEACAQFDAVLGLNVETPTALSPGELAALAAGLGLQERGNNRFTEVGDGGEALFSLALGERAEQLTLLLDVPRAPQAAEPWARMLQAAHLCAERTGGRVVDDAGQPMTEAASAGVARQLARCYRSLQEAGLDAGSPAALRVFN